METDKLCFAVTDGLIRAWHAQRVEKPTRSTEYTYLIINRCICGECINKQIDFSAEYKSLRKRVESGELKKMIT